MIDEKKLIDKLKQSGMIADNEYGNAMVDMINSQPKIGGWIPCSERLPENSKTEIYDMQLVTLDNGDVCLGVYRHDDKEWFARMSEGETIYSNNHNVIAWQPLPEEYHE